MVTSAYPEANFPLEPVIQPSTNSATAFAASTEPRFRCGFVASCNVANRAVSGNVSEGAADAKVGAAPSEQLMSKFMLADMYVMHVCWQTYMSCMYAGIYVMHVQHRRSPCRNPVNAYGKVTLNSGFRNILQRPGHLASADMSMQA